MFRSSILAAVVMAVPALAAAQDATAPAEPATAAASDTQAPAGAASAETVVATVSGEDITLGEMILMKQAVAQDPQMAGLPDQALWDMMLDQLIRQTAVAAAAGDDLSPATRAELELQRRNTLAASVISRIADSEPTDAEIQAVYDRTFGETAPVTEYSAAHILVETEDEAKAIKTELDGGADFGALAEEKSTDNSGPNKGDLGWFTADQMVQPFGDAVKSLDKGAVSDPVQTQFGWHLIKLNDSRQKDAPKLDEVREQMAQLVRRDKVEAEINRTVSEAQVERTEGLDPALLSQTDLLEAN